MGKRNDSAAPNSGDQNSDNSQIKVVNNSVDSQESRPSFNDLDPGPSCSSSRSDPLLSPVAGPSCAKDDIDEEESSSDESDVQAAILDAITKNFDEAKYEQDLIDFMSRIQPLTPMREIIESLKNSCNKKNLKQCSTSSESELSDNRDSESSSSDSSSDTGKKKNRKRYKYLPSDESDLFSSDENITSDEDSPNYQKKMLKARMRDILSTGYEKIRKKFGKPNYDLVVPKRLENIKLHPSVVEEKKNPIFDEEDRAIINYETTDDFSRFVLYDLPNIPDNDDYENDEAVKRWAASLDQQDDLQEAQKYKIDGKSKMFDVINEDLSDLLALKSNSDMAKNCGLSSAAKSQKQKSKQTTGKKTPKVPAKRSNSKAFHSNKEARKCAKISPKHSIASSKSQKSKTAGKTPRKQPASRVKLSNQVSFKSAKSPSKKAKDNLECKSAQKSPSSSPRKVRTGLVKKNVLKQSEGNVELKSKKCITPSPKRRKTGLASKATLKQSKGNFKNKPVNKSTVASSKGAKASLMTEIPSEHSKGDVQNQTILKSPVTKRGRKSLASKIALKQSEGNFKNQTPLKSSAAKREIKNLGTKITSKQSEGIVKNQILLKSPVAKTGGKSLGTKIVSKQSEGNFENQTFHKSPVAKIGRESSVSLVLSKQLEYINKQNSSEFITPPLKKMRTSLSKKNTEESCKLSHKLSTSALCSKLLSKKSKYFRGRTPPSNEPKLSPKKVSVVKQKQNKVLKKVTKLNKSVEPKDMKSKESVASVAKLRKQLKSAVSPKSSVQNQNLGPSKSSLPCKTKLITRAAKTRGLSSLKMNTSFSTENELISSTSEKQSKSGKLSNMKQGLKQPKVDRSVHLQSKKSEKSTAKPGNGPMLRAKRVIRMKKK